MNLTIQGMSDMYAAIRQLEFAILQVSQSIDALMSAIECIMSGKAPVNLITPRVLHNILKNVSLDLPVHHELIFGTRFDNINLYYQAIEVVLVGDTHHVKLILNVPLKSESQVFELHRLFTFPTEITNDTHVEFKPTYTFLAYNQIYQSYSLLTEEEMKLCVGQNKIVVCPVRKAIYATDVLTCESSPEPGGEAVMSQTGYLESQYTHLEAARDDVAIAHANPTTSHVPMCGASWWNSREAVWFSTLRDASWGNRQLHIPAQLAGTTETTVNEHVMFIPGQLATVA